MDITATKLGANMAIGSLEASGQIGSAKKSNVEIIPEAIYEFATGVAVIPVSALPRSGEVATLTIDDETHTAEVKCVAAEGMEIIYIGNGGMFGLEDAGESFFGLFGDEDGEANVQIAILTDIESELTTHTISLSCVTEVIKPISPKFMPVFDIDLNSLGVNTSDSHGAFYKFYDGVADEFDSNAADAKLPAAIKEVFWKALVRGDKMRLNITLPNGVKLLADADVVRYAEGALETGLMRSFRLGFTIDIGSNYRQVVSYLQIDLSGVSWGEGAMPISVSGWRLRYTNS